MKIKSIRARRRSRIAILLVCLTAMLALPASAAAYFSGSYFWTVQGPQQGPVIHIHSQSAFLTFNNQVQNSTYRSLTASARNEWEQRSIARLNLVSGPANITAYDGFYGATGWAGLSSVSGAFDPTFGHYGQNMVQINRTYTDAYSNNQRRGVACQEIGHGLGVGHGGTGCMGFGYYVGGDNTTIRSPTDLDIYHVNYLYGFGNHQ